MVWDKIILNIFVVNNNMRYDLIIRNITLLFTVFTISVFGGKSVAYAQRPLYKADTLTIKVFGDIMMHKAQIDAAHKGWGKYFTYIEDEIKNADLAVANMDILPNAVLTYFFVQTITFMTKEALVLPEL